MSYRRMTARNVTRGTVLASDGLEARGMRQRILGLHLLPQLKEGQGLLLPGATTIDSTFMRYPIDLVFVDRARKVTRVVHDMQPWRMVWSAHGGRDCLELPAGTARATETQVGDQLEISELEG